MWNMKGQEGDDPPSLTHSVEIRGVSGLGVTINPLISLL